MRKRPPYNKFFCGIDADIVSYVAASVGKSDSDCQDVCDRFVGNLIYEISGDFPDEGKLEFYLTGKGNFRYSIYNDYKANRSPSEKPKFLDGVRDYLIERWGAEVVEGQEADDRMATRACEEGYNYIIASTDKDFLQVPCWIYNWTKKIWSKPSEKEANLSLYTQMLTGDRVDNIPGIKGVGPVKAGKILKGCDTEESMWDSVLEAYEGDVETLTRNARLLYLRRRREETWMPPKGR